MVLPHRHGPLDSTDFAPLACVLPPIRVDPLQATSVEVRVQQPTRERQASQPSPSPPCEAPSICVPSSCAVYCSSSPSVPRAVVSYIIHGFPNLSNWGSQMRRCCYAVVKFAIESLRKLNCTPPELACTQAPQQTPGTPLRSAISRPHSQTQIRPAAARHKSNSA